MTVRKHCSAYYAVHSMHPVKIQLAPILSHLFFRIPPPLHWVRQRVNPPLFSDTGSVLSCFAAPFPSVSGKESFRIQGGTFTIHSNWPVSEKMSANRRFPHSTDYVEGGFTTVPYPSLAYHQ